MIIEINSINIHYHVSGKGNNLILLHGWDGEIKSFEPIHKHLEKYFKTFSIDFPGFGKSSLPNQPWGTIEYSDILAKFLKKQGINKLIVIAHSFGGRVAIRLAAAYPELINKMILIDSAGIKPKRTYKYYIKVYLYKSIKYMVKMPIINLYTENILKFISKRIGSKDYQNVSGVMRKTFVRIVNEDLKNLLPKIKPPTLLIWGENDQATPVSNGKLMERLIPDSGLVVLRNAGHFSYLENLDEFLLITENFLKDDIKRKHD